MPRIWVIFAVPLIVLGTLLIGAAVFPWSSPPQQERQAPTEGREHVEIGTPITYRNRPPNSGPHYERTLRYGVFESEAEPGYWVHTLEHGGIVLLYNCAGPCPRLVEELRRVYLSAPESQKYHVVKLAVVPFRDMDRPLAAVAWGYVDEMDVLDGDRVLAFYRAHVDRGPEEAL